jgi:hypothetical protein
MKASTGTIVCFEVVVHLFHQLVLGCIPVNGSMHAAGNPLLWTCSRTATSFDDCSLKDGFNTEPSTWRNTKSLVMKHTEPKH